MARPKKYKVELTDEDLKLLKSTIRKNKTSKIVLDTPVSREAIRRA